ncbi:MAG TPA: hypothetical protein VHB97_11425, partial [Polyangia bacterium]|nr:hypothetical protein [Polyangia bacterium]
MRTTLFLSITLAAAIAGMMLAGCGNAVAVGGDGGQDQPIVGTWLSQGADVAPLLAGSPFNNAKITATFKNDATYTVVSIDTSNKELDYSGTYQIMPSTVNNIIQIRLAEVTPSTAEVEGMYQIDTTQMPPRMQYEVVQTQPTNGLQPPSPDKGFGSTLYNGMQISTLIQKYSRQ